MGLLEEVTARLGDTGDVLPITEDIVLVVTHEKPTGVFRCTRDQDDQFLMGIILEREALTNQESTALAAHLSSRGVEWNPNEMAAEFRRFSEEEDR